jgi:hypothetical protein
MADRFAEADAALEVRREARRAGADISARSIRRDRQRLQALQLHPALVPAEEPPAFAPRGLQGQTSVRLPGDQWTQWQVCPSLGGRSGRRMSSQATFNEEAGLMRVRFESGGRSGTGNTYQYDGIDRPTWNAFMAGRLGANATATHSFLMGRDGVQI